MSGFTDRQAERILTIGDFKSPTSYSLPRSLFRKLVHFFSFHFILNRGSTSTTTVSGLRLTVPPTVFHPKLFLTSKFFADFVQNLDLRNKSVVEVGTGSGILALSAAKARAAHLLALNPAAVAAAQKNAVDNGFADKVTALESDLFAAVPPSDRFDVIISSPPSFAGEPLNVADRAWHAGPNYCTIAPLFAQARTRLKPKGKMYLLLSSDSDLELFATLTRHAGFSSRLLAERSIVVETFLLFELASMRDVTPTASN
ncbi:methyltransferase [Bradyrhizobium prioriisuperbiae]|uniref:methyltransferase n=1 Tax=Bradyrhizobium prioriisuperbiae TaxID=2854389 RepID=UPI0028EEAE66|nr:methyltransferase [Bradyrhizobium prioritasuperba]